MRRKKRRLTILIKDAALRRWPILNFSGLSFSTGENGGKDASWTMPVEFTFNLEEVFLNGVVYILTNTGDIVWYGRVESIQPSKSGDSGSVAVTATGSWSALYDFYVSGTLGSATTPEALIASMVSGFTFDTSGLTATGLTGRSYATPNDGTDVVRAGDAILEVCRMGGK